MTSITSRLYTIGYEGVSMKDFLATLKASNIEIILDIRALPLSRRPGFSKTPLRNALKEAGIDYIHLRGLGTPKAGRDAAKSGDLDLLHIIYEGYLKGEEAQTDLARAISIAKEQSACLLCVERHHTACHRSLVAPHIVKKTGQNVINLKVEAGSALQAALL